MSGIDAAPPYRPADILAVDIRAVDIGAGRELPWRRLEASPRWIAIAGLHAGREPA